MNLHLYCEQEKIRVANNYNKAKHRGFINKYDFAEWFVNQLKASNYQCYYCETSIHDIRKLIEAGLLTERKIGNGFRGKILEVDKNDNDYTKEQCVLSCYYCNNDKSYTLDKNVYKENFGANRNLYFKKLITKLYNNVEPIR